jgi:hypothetical protein
MLIVECATYRDCRQDHVRQVVRPRLTAPFVHCDGMSATVMQRFRRLSVA